MAHKDGVKTNKNVNDSDLAENLYVASSKKYEQTFPLAFLNIFIFWPIFDPYFWFLTRRDPFFLSDLHDFFINGSHGP